MLRDHGQNIVIYEPSLCDETFMGIPVIRDLNVFKNQSEIIVANRATHELADVNHKLFTRDIFGYG